MKKLKIFDVPWHIGHQYEQLKFPFAEWYWLMQPRRQYNETPRGDLVYRDEGFQEGTLVPAWVKRLMDKNRPLPLGMGFNWVPYYEPGKYDVAILHLDQQCLEQSLLERGKGSVYREMNAAIKDIPKIVVMHGTPYYPEMFANSQDMITKVKELVGDNYFVVNSHRAAEQWGFGKTIIHGMDPNEWFDLPKEPRVVTMVSPGGLDMYYDRTFLEHTREALREKGISHCHITVDFQAKNWEEYRDFLGRSLIYFNPTKESPMPRSRTEAMLSGCCVITTPHQDADRFIKDGENGFICPRNPQYVADLVHELLNNYDTAIKIGQAGKKTALELFDHKRYQRDWEEYLNFVINDWKQK